MSVVVVDASAMLAMILEERGSDVVGRSLPTAVMSVVNAAEVTERLHRNLDIAAVKATLAEILPPTIAADLELATDAGLLTAITRPVGLSLGDRFCLALARRLSCPVITADRDWLKIANAVGVEVQVIR